MRAVIVGGGIGGLATAIALDRVGIDSIVLEQAPELEEVGAGLTLSPNAVHALERLGLADAVRSRGARGQELLVRSWKGKTILEVRLGDPMEEIGIHRADLQDILVEGAGGNRVRLGTRVTDVVADGERPRVELADGSTEEADLLIGADGIHSVVRRRILGAAAEPDYAGYVGWRAVIDYDDDLVRGRFVESWGRGDRFGLVPVGGGRLYWFVSEKMPKPDVDRPDVKARLARTFADWHAPIPAVVDLTPEDAISGTGIFDRKPVRSWTSGRVTLLGDAAHPMTPNMGQGAGQALEDAVVLAASLRDAATAEAGLLAYERERIRRTTPIVKKSRQLGRVAHAGGAAGSLRDGLFRVLPKAFKERQQSAIVHYDLPPL
jgi:2-polyprenyl-6-methoxyphenol hydroxylase-like FAD-dependent oxidoreductase